ncbi:putative lipoprotein [Myxococcus xanthus DK 1622]|uniref:Lipoprotein n=1 Tax=Myxococcus xanthus (strain DK1622) TaxID=246197 RepID=Q1DFC7_MYXXD|nr:MULTISPECIES: hypothetical protein [Myxococcus]ABF91645.1 putative lipoprotein [Myxococcus xanthus DK 1622]NOJ53077.1 hypothetical protein [Myxococcus xanthus]QPM80090.1 hypothetical protein I5Q59_01945 [Myxococcus xanthus]QVW69154.1 hypothetical protein JTM82_06235 [Myxococcus xanthus DZ2]UEO04718.1 hypothetical protein K1515_36575 [Myxococcus xanthus DZ2]
MGIRRRWLGLSMVMGLSLGTGCMSPSQEAQERLAALEAEGEAMDAVLDSVEERLLGNQAMLQTWQELGRRHQQVTQLHCETSDPHMIAMMKHYKKQEDRARQLKRRGSGVASVDKAVLTSGKAPRGNN